MSGASTGTDHREFRLPDLGEGLTESEIVAWRVGVGDTVSLNQVIGEVETAKAVVELPSPYSGRIAALLAEPGQVVAVGTPIVVFDDALADADRTAGPAPRREPNLVGYGALPERTGRPARKIRTWASPDSLQSPKTAEPRPTEPQAPAPRPRLSPQEPRAEERPRSTPPVRKLAKDLGVDLAGVRGSGPCGRVTREDLLHHAGPSRQAEPTGTVQSGAPTSAPARARETRTPIRGVRKQTAAAMVASAFSAPHATEFLTVDVTRSMELLARLRGSKAFAALKITPMTLVAKAVLIALQRTPSVNSHWDEAAQQIVQYHYVNLGFAAATPRGLMVPNVKDADTMGLPRLAEAIADLVASARQGHASPADLTGGTITITNIGVFGIDAGTPILNPGEAAILATGQVRRTPWEHLGEIALRDIMTLSLSFDHRLVDGEQASRFLADVGALLADPSMAIALA